jgi:hypothetical protein
MCLQGICSKWHPSGETSILPALEICSREHPGRSMTLPRHRCREHIYPLDVFGNAAYYEAASGRATVPRLARCRLDRRPNQMGHGYDLLSKLRR